MSIKDSRKIDLIKNLLKSIHQGESVESIKEKFRDVLLQVSPFEIPLIEQELIREGIPISEILKLCDLHVELFREFLASKELKDVPKGHPLDVLVRENEYILKKAEALGLYANAVLGAKNVDEARSNIESIKTIVKELKSIRVHYRKVQMLIFPYLERRGIVAIPRVLWGREDRVLLKIRELLKTLAETEIKNLKQARDVASKALEIARDLSELVFRENKILYPTIWTLFSEGEWVAIKELSKDLGYLVEVEEEWSSNAKPVYPYEIEEAVVPKEQLEKLPKELQSIIAHRGIEPDKYRIRDEKDIDLDTGFLSTNEIKAVFASLPLELTYANNDDRVKFYTNSRIAKGFIRTKTIIGRKVEYCHPPRLEYLVKKVIRELKETSRNYREFWTKIGDRIIRVLIVAVRDEKGKYLGTLEIVEDMTEVIRNPEEIMKKIMVL
ncbi:DUF438 domain-containing protein [Desulfurococcaceae archaeon MEX13E-LK6-19]|nr:DUF438 domain-containing protein [Desulfurococcaceae archaeon MEX13E-LK6-19]